MPGPNPRRISERVESREDVKLSTGTAEASTNVATGSLQPLSESIFGEVLPEIFHCRSAKRIAKHEVPEKTFRPQIWLCEVIQQNSQPEKPMVIFYQSKQ